MQHLCSVRGSVCIKEIQGRHYHSIYVAVVLKKSKVLVISVVIEPLVSTRGQQPIKIAYKIYKSQDFYRFLNIFKDLKSLN